MHTYNSHKDLIYIFMNKLKAIIFIIRFKSNVPFEF